jgi:hypothetical protein
VLVVAVVVHIQHRAQAEQVEVVLEETLITELLIQVAVVVVVQIQVVAELYQAVLVVQA